MPNVPQVSAPAHEMITPRVAHLFHSDVLFAEVHRTDPVADYRALAQAGIWGLIRKATQGLGVNDPAYAPRIRNARLSERAGRYCVWERKSLRLLNALLNSTNPPLMHGRR
jgi:hypothetical protein